MPGYPSLQALPVSIARPGAESPRIRSARGTGTAARAKELRTWTCRSLSPARPRSKEIAAIVQRQWREPSGVRLNLSVPGGDGVGTNASSRSNTRRSSKIPGRCSAKIRTTSLCRLRPGAHVHLDGYASSIATSPRPMESLIPAERMKALAACEAQLMRGNADDSDLSRHLGLPGSALSPWRETQSVRVRRASNTPGSIPTGDRNDRHGVRCSGSPQPRWFPAPGRRAPTSGARWRRKHGGSCTRWVARSRASIPRSLLVRYEFYVIPALFEGLTQYHPELPTPMAALATHYEANADFTQFRFYLRGHPAPRGSRLPSSTDLPDKFLRGRATSPDSFPPIGAMEPDHCCDFVYSWRRFVDPQIAAPLGYSLLIVKNAQEIFQANDRRRILVFMRPMNSRSWLICDPALHSFLNSSRVTYSPPFQDTPWKRPGAQRGVHVD